MSTAQDLIQQLRLQPHPEGGYYRETYRASLQTTAENGAARNVSTAIYYLLEDNDRSHFHRIQSDELWFFHQGQALEMLLLENGQLTVLALGHDVGRGEMPQAVVPAHTWFGARVKGGVGFALVSCTVAPGFDFADFELADRARLTQEFPEQAAVIEQLT
ncbi:cupin domain-containing protein [Hymenobacter convexus]|uniref:cupin domain-containing protein n=1 Tax=Hymenobacter sp. CA1UV-4 TaxID=3063782 RepID=UPI00271316B0|nr:cupin domain-containing protein [Hymenobacter sp. CA1UV-4]MDO7854292.1 cupin domain-containing protein [Hymenobacter sp. CA1UV-4]